jgi:hypothetical protein
MKRFVLITLVIGGLTAVAATTEGSTDASPSAAQCGGSLWRMKTLSDPQRKLVQLTPTATTIGVIDKKPTPNPVPKRRRTQFQRQVWNVVSQITQYRLESGGVRLVLFDAGTYVNAVIPNPNCLRATSRARTQMKAAWQQFTECARATPQWQSLGAVAYVGGVGFWGPKGRGRGQAINGAELHPVTGIRIVAGC